MSNLSILMEAYRGKKNEFPEIEAQLKILINTIRQDANKRLNSKTITDKALDVKNHPANKKVEKLLAQAFKTKEVNIYWKPKMYNACTVPPILPKASELHKNLDNDGVVTNAKINIYIGEAIVSLTSINEKELMAIILHEIGHCHAISPIMVAVNLLQMTIFLPTVLLEKLIILVGVKFDEFMRKHVSPIYNISKWFYNMDLSIMATFKKILNLPIGINIGNYTPAVSVMKYGRYAEEKIADSFATSFGYAPYLISGLDKMDMMDNSVDNTIAKSNNISRIISDTVDLYRTFMYLVRLEEHPSINTRYHNALRNLKEDLNDPNLDPLYKKEMLEQIKELEDAYETLSKRGGKGPELKHNVNKFIDKLTNNNPDFREIFNVYSDRYRF